jgi:sugar O-acyltransferase (sialic acid O-acetyltransferase NeuD family)
MSNPKPGLRITQPARALADKLGVDVSTLPADQLITTAVVYRYAGRVKADVEPVRRAPTTDRRLIIYGGGGHARTLLEAAQAMGTFDIAGIVDDGIAAGSSILGVPVLGSRALLPELLAQGIGLAINGVGGIADVSVRVLIFNLLESLGFALPVVQHPRASVERSAEIGAGAQVLANAYIGSGAVLQAKSLVNTNAVVSHDCVIGSFAHVAPGALLAGHVRVGERALIGMGVTAAIGVKIGAGARIGNSAALYGDVPDNISIPARVVWDG